MDKTQKALIGIIVVLVLAVGALLIKRYFPFGERPLRLGKDAPCPDERTMVMQDYYMRGLIEFGHKYKALINYYACNPVQKGDYVLYRFSNTLPPVVRIVRAVEGDKIELTKDKKRKAWNIRINGELLMVGNEPHFFGTDTALPPLGLAKGSRGDGLLPGDVIVFSSWAPGDQDSSVFGLTNIEDIIGKVEAIPGQYPEGFEPPFTGTKKVSEIESNVTAPVKAQEEVKEVEAEEAAVNPIPESSPAKKKKKKKKKQSES